MKNKSKYLGNEELYLNKVLNSENWSSTEGTSTMHSALEALGVGPGDEVISPALSVIMNTSTTIHANAIPVYADILPDTYTIDPRDVERKITSKTKAIMIVSVYGLPCEMDELMAISKKHNIPLFTYEEIYLNKRIDRLNEYLGIDRNENLENLYINNNRDRIINLKETMI